MNVLQLKPHSALVLALAGALLSGIGLYFIFMRPGLLAEDLRYMGTTTEKVNLNMPSLTNWLQKVFLVMGGFIFTTGLMTLFMSMTSFKTRNPGTFILTVIAGLSSIGLLTIVNFMIGSDFKWPLLVLALLWALALILYRFNK